MAAKTAPTLSTIERLLEEVEEWSERVRKIRQKLARSRRGSEAYLDLLSDLEVELDVLKLKAQHAAEAIEEFQDLLRENE